MPELIRRAMPESGLSQGRSPDVIEMSVDWLPLLVGEDITVQADGLSLL